MGTTALTKPEEQALATRPIAETPAAAAAARAKAEIEAAFTIALARPRDSHKVRRRLLDACATSAFADDKSAWYRKPVGSGQMADGPGIRFAEEYMRCARNLLARTGTVYEDEEKLIVRAQVIDLERNAWQEQEIRITKTVWRKSPRKGQEIIGQKTNAKGQTTYLVRADEDDLLAKIQGAASKALRNCMVRLMPRDLIQEGKEAIMETRAAPMHKDPDAARKALLDGFAKLRVPVDEITDWLEHDIESMTPEEYTELRTLLDTVRTRETTWQKVMQAKRAGAVEEGELGLEDLESGEESEGESAGAPPEAGTETEPGEKGGENDQRGSTGSAKQAKARGGRQAGKKDKGRKGEPEGVPGTPAEAGGRETQQASAEAQADAEIEIPSNLPLRLDQVYTLHPTVFEEEAGRLGVDGMQIDDMADDQQAALYRAIHARLKEGE